MEQGGRRVCTSARRAPLRRGRGAWTTAAAFAGLLAAADAPAADCSVSTAGVAFGVYDVSIATPTDAVGNLTVTCVYVSGGGTHITYTAALTTGASGNFAQRLLRAGTAILNYNLYDSATYTRVWGDGTAGTGVIAGAVTVGPGAGNNTRQESYPIYGRIPAQQGPGTGDYTDTIIVTLAF